MRDIRHIPMLCLAFGLTCPAPLLAAGGGGGGYVSDAPIPWHMTQDGEGRNVIELIPHAELRIGLELTEVTERMPPEPPAQEIVVASAEELQTAAAIEDPPEIVKVPVLPQLTVPYGSLIYWADGTTWVYGENGAERHYVRLPVNVDRIEGETVYLRSGPPVGTQIVAVGAAELFGAETGTGH
ncbi:hypothetical protein OEZ60_02175 [Defluviimonas sp. WL0024]|uniref:Uncharacterized protein n=2 Tax=Albidovulum TaxID=205889 RepID=A0ABT3J0U9_9RHOB|nr:MULTISPECIES: hypothetical protein [Defluviimonas]MCU9846800.1 hypothetical protein [Defluviimonas sp. WL0024]MCW3781059.1 hypothetical protein [Defluviimonas salinarum]